uniref:alpha subunit of RNA polymerase n=1 Tax=Tetradesmus distendus TaxID=113531 RepID=UPI0030032BFC|nr:alpha subunit of RNA polymerase [Tetradesmus distendus]
MHEKIQDFFLSCKECILENPQNFYGSFSLGPFKNSQSLTVANALRRTLLAELSGIAITHLEIEGVTHEYSTLVGVRESVLDLLLNFKGIVLKNTSPVTKPLFGYLQVRGPGVVRAADLKFPPMIQCVDPDQYIATLNENGKLILKFRISDFKNSQINLNLEASKTLLNIPNFGNFDNNSYLSFGCSSSSPVEQPKGREQPKVMAVLRLPLEEGKGADQNFENSKKTKFNQLKVNHRSPFGFSTVHKNIGSNQTQKFAAKQQNLLRIEKTKQDFDKNKNGNIENQKNETNSLWVDPLFNPILKVNYIIETIEPMQKNIPNEIVFIELWTNGSIYPRKAFYSALLYLKTMFDKLDCMRLLNYEFSNAMLESEKTSTKFLKTFEYDFRVYNFQKDKTMKTFIPEKFFLPEEIENVQKDYLFDLKNQADKTWNDVPLTNLNLPPRITKILAKNNLVVVGDVLKMNPNELKKLSGIGNYCVFILQKHFEKLGLKLGMTNETNL